MSAEVRTRSSGPAEFAQLVPSLRIGSYTEAVAFYVDWLGFHLDWEWREADDQPVIMHVSRSGQAMFLNEYPVGVFGTQLLVHVSDLDAYADELNARRADSATIFLEPPNKIPSLRFTDPFGNYIGFQGPPVGDPVSPGASE
jgi:catechol 2,3-dioxygenase-like lactoylglutathione lyase family enzyme